MRLRNLLQNSLWSLTICYAMVQEKMKELRVCTHNKGKIVHRYCQVTFHGELHEANIPEYPGVLSFSTQSLYSVFCPWPQEYSRGHSSSLHSSLFAVASPVSLTSALLYGCFFKRALTHLYRMRHDHTLKNFRSYESSCSQVWNTSNFSFCTHFHWYRG